MSAEIPVLNASKVPESEFYVMECTLTVERSERIGEYADDRRMELQGYLSKEILEAVLDLTAKMVER
jgi:hypothetical protein